MKLLQLLKDFSFVIRLSAMVVNTLTVSLWRLFNWESEATPPYETRIGQVLFAHAVTAYVIILPVLLLRGLGLWGQRVFVLAGLVLFLPLGVVGVIVCARRHGNSLQLTVSILCLVVGLLLLADFVKTEKLFCGKLHSQSE